MWSVIGHDREVAALTRSLEEGRASHAYLITGPASVGKARLASDLARALNCTGDCRPCDDCRPCRLIQAGRHPDVELVTVGGLCDEADHDHRRDGSKDIKICQVRRVERVIALHPFEGRVRVIVVDPADWMNVHAADAFLKTLEEPPDSVVIVLISAAPARLPETIASRTRRIALMPVASEVIEAELARRGTDADRAQLLARLAGGRIGWALMAGQDDSPLQERERWLGQMEDLLRAGRTNRLAFAASVGARFSREREGTFALLDLWQSWWRDVLLVREGCERLVINTDRLSAFAAAAKLVTSADAVRALQALRSCRQHLEDNVNARLALEALVLRLPSPVTREEAGARKVVERR